MLWLNRTRGARSPSSAATIATANVVPIITSSMRRSSAANTRLTSVSAR